MIELFKFFRILFLSEKISRDRLKDFTEDHIQRLNQNNPGGLFTAILNAVTNAYNNFYGDLSSEELNIAVQQGKTIALNESREALIKNISDNEKLIAYTYRDNAMAYEEFYPEGLDEYHQATTSGLETIGDRFASALAAHSADFPPAFINDYNTLLTTYKSNRAAQQAAFGAVAGERSDMQTTRPELAKQLTTNLLTIALQYVGDESKADVYFNQAILNDAFRESETKVELTLDPGATANAFDNVTKPELMLTCTNNSDEVLYIGFKAAPAQSATENDHHLQPHSEGSIKAADIGWTSTNKFLNVTNPNGTTVSVVIEKK